MRLDPVRCSLISVLISAALTGSEAVAAGDMLQPSEIQTEGESANPANDSGVFVGGGLAFGQVRTTEDGASPGLGFLMKFEPGYQIKTGSWSRIELSADVLTGRYAFRTDDDAGGKVTMPLKLGLLLKAGYGYSLGSGMNGVARVGFGPLLADFKGEINDYKVESEDTISGFGFLFAYDLVVNATDVLDFVGGIGILHSQFDVGDVKDNQGNKQKIDKNVIANMSHVSLGLRLRL